MAHFAPQPCPEHLKNWRPQVSPPPPPKVYCPKPEPPRCYLMRDDSAKIAGYINDDGTVEWVCKPGMVARIKAALKELFA